MLVLRVAARAPPDVCDRHCRGAAQQAAHVVAAAIGSRQYTQGRVGTATDVGAMMVGSSGTRIIRLAAFRRQCTSGEGGTRSGRTQARRVLSVSHGFVSRGPTRGTGPASKSTGCRTVRVPRRTPQQGYCRLTRLLRWDSEI